MSINYNEISKKYDNVRSESLEILKILSEEINISPETRILDFGCGTGNYANLLQRLTGAQVYGVEPSDGMRCKAEEKNEKIIFSKGNHEYIPFKDSFFDFVYMTDVIHHVPDLTMMFKEIGRVLKREGKLCIVTQSHIQIKNRFFVKYFPTTAIADKSRYPDIDEVIGKAQNEGFEHLKNIVNGEGSYLIIDSGFANLVRNKGFSMFHLIPEDEFESGLKQLEVDLAEGGDSFDATYSGDTLIWLQKGGSNFDKAD